MSEIEVDQSLGKQKYQAMMTLQPPELDEIDLDNLELPDIDQLPSLSSVKKEDSKKSDKTSLQQNPFL